MKIANLIRRAAVSLAFAAMLGATSAWGGILNELPTTRINGQVMYFYDVQSGDNIYNIAEKLGISTQQIRQYNPSTADGIKPRMRLYFPTDVPPSEPYTEATDGPLTHVYQKDESIYSIAHRYGMSVDDIMALNPSIASGLRPGMRLLLQPSQQPPKAEASQAPSAAPSSQEPPFRGEAEASQAPSQAPSAAPSSQEPPFRGEAEASQAPSEALSAAPSSQEPPFRGEAEASDPLNMAIILPFMLDEQKMSRQTQLYTEFYKGFLLAADTLNRAGRAPISLHIFDSAANLDSVRAIMNSPLMQQMNMIIMPDNAAQMATIARTAPKDAFLVNIFAVKDTSYRSIPSMIQTNIPHSEMYNHAIAGFIDSFSEATPVFLARRNGRTDKEEFTDKLKSALSAKGIIYSTISYENTLSDTDLEDLDLENRSYIFIPVSGHRDEFSHFSRALKNLKGKAVNPEAVQLFGYPEWATFRGDQFDELCNLQTTIYSRYFPTDRDPDAQTLSRLFRSTYGEGIIDKQMPVLGILGYDTGMFLIEALRTWATTGSLPTEFTGIQSGLRLSPASSSSSAPGLFNNALFLITYSPGSIIQKSLR